MNVREFLNELFNVDNHDGVMFYPLDDENMDIRGFFYADKSNYKLGVNGQQFYHIVLYKQDDNKKITESDNFNAVLLDPSVYISNLIKCGWYGFVGKITDTSQKDFDKTYETLIKKTSQPPIEQIA